MRIEKNKYVLDCGNYKETTTKRFLIDCLEYEREFCNVVLFDMHEEGYKHKKFYYDEDMNQKEFEEWIEETIERMNEED